MRKNLPIFAILISWVAYGFCSQPLDYSPDPIDSGVNVVTGQYIEMESDLSLTGAKTFALTRWIHFTEENSSWEFNVPNVLANTESRPDSLQLQDTKLVYGYNEKGQIDSIEVRSQEGDALYHTISFSRPNAQTVAASSKGQTVVFSLSPGLTNRDGMHAAIERIQKPNGVTVEYSYLEHPQKRMQLVAKRTENGVLSLENSYYDGKHCYVGNTYVPMSDPVRDFRIGRVKTQKIYLVGQEEEVEKHFFYYSGKTEVIDTASKAKRVYTYLPTGKITSLEHWDISGPAPKKVKRMRFVWKGIGKEKNLYLIAKALEDGQGRIVTATTYEYDPQGLLKKETLYGDLLKSNPQKKIIFNAQGDIIAKNCDSCSTSYLYRKVAGAYVLAQKIQSPGIVTKYCYEEKTGRVKGIFFGNEKKILLRHIISYDDKGNLIETIIDDGKTETLCDDPSVSVRKRTTLHLSQEKDTYGLPLTITESQYTKETGEVTQFIYTNHYSEAGKLCRQKIEDCLNESVEYKQWHYDSYHRLIRFENREQIEQYAYSPKGFLLWKSTSSKSDEKEKKLFYDAWGRISLCEEKFSPHVVQKTHYTYNKAGYLEKTTDRFGNATYYKTDVFGNILEKTLPAVVQGNKEIAYPKETYVYDCMGNCVYSANPLGYETVTSYNCRGQKIEEHFADGSYEAYNYSLSGRPLFYRDRTGIEHHYSYDPFGRKIEEQSVSPSGKVNKHQLYEYEGFSLKSCQDLLSGETIELKEKTPSLALSDKSTSPDIARPVAHLEGHINEIGIEVGKMTWIYPNGSKTVQILDSAERPQHIYQYDPFGTLWKEETNLYDLAGNLLFHKVSHYDKKGNKRESSIAYTRGPLGRVESLIEAPSSLWARVTSYQYDSCGRIERIIKPDDVSIFLSYTEEGKIASIRSSDGSVDYAHTYDAQGRVIHTFDAVHAYNYRFDYADETTYIEHYPQGYWLQKTVRETEAVLRFSDNSSITYFLNENHLLSEVKRTQADGTSYSIQYEAYTEKGKPLSLTLPFFLGKVEYAYEESGALKEISSLFYKERLFQNDEKWERQISALEEQNVLTYETNWQNYITKGPEMEYEYDSSGNRLYANGKELLYNPLGQLLNDGETQFSYDENGNVLSLHSGKTSYRFSYDAFNRLSWVYLEDGSSYHYIYDAKNRRIQKQVFVSNANGSSTMAYEENYLYNGLEEIASLDRSLNIKQLRIIGTGPTGQNNNSLAIEIAGKPYVPLQDITGSVCCIIDPETQEVVEKTLYSPFGKELQSGEEPLSPWRFAGKRCDPETGLIYFGYRYLLPESGRWLTLDPAGFLDGPNRYLFAHNNPLHYRDSFGLFSVSEFIQSSWNAFFYAMHAFQGTLSNLYYSLDLEVSYLRHIQPTVSTVFEEYFGKGFLAFAGFYAHAPEVGVFGHGEITKNVRITCLNGIGNLRYYYKGFLEQLSNSHGGMNVHYIFHPTEGYTRDVFQAAAIRFGWVSPYARTLANAWKDLIQEMGGVGEGGVIYHYCHSLGGGDTRNALYLLTPEERQMIHVFSFGAPVVMTDSLGLASVHNYVGMRDPVPLFDPISLACSLFYPSYHVHLLGNMRDFSLFDHAIDGPTYGAQIADLGQQFIERHFFQMAY